MAELIAASWSGRQMRAQCAAVAVLRWRMLRNGFFRGGNRAESIARLVLYPLLFCLLFLPAVGAGAGAFSIVSSGQLERLSWLFWGIFLLAQFANINLGQPGTTFDPRQLIRFPLPLRQFVFLRLFFGLLSPANLLVALMGVAVAIGCGLALPGRWPSLSLALLVFIAVNILFSRMAFAWVDRWLSTRRAREVFTALLFVGSLGVQYANVRFTSEDTTSRFHTTTSPHVTLATRFYARAHPVLAALPPELTARSVQLTRRGNESAAALTTGACALYGVLFLRIFALRMRSEFRGETLTDEAHGGSALTRREPLPATDVSPARPGSLGRIRWPPASVRAVLAKELLYTRRNTGILYSLIAPVAMVFLFAGRLATRSSTSWVFPAALVYTLVGVMPLSYNSLGLEGAGVQFYFLAPTPLREIIFAKNLIGFGLAALEAATTLLVVTVLTGKPGISLLVSSLLWALATLLLNTCVGNLRSLAAPRQIKLSRLSGKQVSPLSALMSLGVLLLSAAIGAGILFTARWLHLPWLAPLTFAAAALVAGFVYNAGLRRLDRFALDHREALFAELCKA